MKYIVAYCCVMVSLVINAGGQCKVQGCLKYAGRSGYCEMHREYARSNQTAPKSSPSASGASRVVKMEDKEFSVSSLKSKLNEFNEREGDAPSEDLSAVVERVRKACVLVLNYR